jgi:PAS domain S-box-containing protein
MINFELPGCGFGFWYIHGMYHNMKRYSSDEPFFLTGKSGGAIVCFLSLLKEECQQFDFLMDVCIKINEMEKKGCIINLYNYVYHFLMTLTQYIDTETVNKNLKNMEIVTTRVYTMACIPYKLKRMKTKPKNLNHLINLVCASCFVPLMSRTPRNPCCYTVDDEWMIDGAFLDMFIIDKKSKQRYKIRSEHSKFSIPSKNECIEMYYNGLFNMHESPPFDMAKIHLAFSNIPPVFPSYSLLVEYIETSEISLVLTDERGLVEELNESWSNLCGYTKQDIEGKTLELLQGKETDPEIIKEINDKVRQGEEIQTTIVNYKKNKSTFLNNVFIKPVYVPVGDHHIAELPDSANTLSNIDLKCHFISWISNVNSFDE